MASIDDVEHSPLDLARPSRIVCDFKVINRIVNEKAQVTPNLAIRLAAALNTTPDFWLNAQKALDIYNASRKIKHLPKSLLRKTG